VTDTSYLQLQSSIEYLATQASKLEGVLDAQKRRVSSIEDELDQLKGEVTTLTYTAVALDQILKKASVESLGEDERLISYGLKTIFDDQNLSFKLVLSMKRNQQWMEPVLMHNDIEGSILDTFGGGPASICAFLLRVLVCRRMKLAPVLLLDEPFAFVSEGYIGNVGKLLRELSEKLHITMILVTHNRGFLEHSHSAYEAKETSSGTKFIAV